MADATLKDVIEEIRAQGDMTRMGSHGSLSVAVYELRGIKSNIQLLNDTFKLAFGELIENGKRQLKLREDEFELLQEEKNRQESRDSLTEDDNKDKEKPVNLKSLLDSIKGLIPKKSPGLFALLFGGLAAALAFIPDWVKSNIIDPIADMFNVMGGGDAETTLGKITGGVGKVIKWLNENIHENAGWVVGAAAVAAILKPSLLTGFAGFVKTALLLAGTQPLLVAAGLAIAGLVKLMDYFRGSSISTETERAEEIRKKYDQAVKDGNKDAMDQLSKEAQAFKDRLKDTSISDVSSITGPLDVVIGKYSEINKKLMENSETEFQTLDKKIAAAELAHKNAEGEYEQASRKAKLDELIAARDAAMRDQESRAARDYKKIFDEIADPKEVLAKAREELDNILKRANEFESDAGKIAFIESKTQRLEEALSLKSRSQEFRSSGQAQLDLSQLNAKITNALAQEDISKTMELLQRQTGDADNINRRMAIPFEYDTFGVDEKAASKAAMERLRLDPTMQSMRTRTFDNIEYAPEFGLPSNMMDEGMKQYMRIQQPQTGGASVTTNSPVDARTYNDNKSTTVNNDNTVINNFATRDAAMVGF